MYAQTLTVVQPKSYIVPKLWYRRVPKERTDARKEQDTQHAREKMPCADLKMLASYRAVSKKIVLLKETASLYPNLPEVICQIVEYVMHEFVAFTDLMQVTMGDPNKQAGFVQYMMSQIDKAMAAVEEFAEENKYSKY